MKLRHLGVILGLALLVVAPLAQAGERALWQTSTLPALMAGVYDGDLTFAHLARQGDFGLGTVNALDGEMIGLDGRFYQIKADGKAYPVRQAMKTPFAMVTFFQPQETIALKEPLDYKQLQNRIAAGLPTPNLPYAIKITGRFSFMKTRSVPRQQPPYARLLEAVKHQSVFEFRDAAGVMVGFLLPSYLAGVNAPGYHFHFLTADRRAGGHVLDCRLATGVMAIQEITKFTLRLPHDGGFSRTDLSGERQQEMEKVEK